MNLLIIIMYIYIQVINLNKINKRLHNYKEK
jgi:hypothetical protein